MARLRSFCYPVLIASIFSAGLSSGAPAATATEKILAGREASSRCEFAQALSLLDEAAILAKTEWRPDSKNFVVLRQDMASTANRLFDFRRAEAEAREALTLAMPSADGGASLERALVAQNLAVALAGQGKRQEAQAIMTEVLPVLLKIGGAPAANALLAMSNLDFGEGKTITARDRLRQAAAMANSDAVPTSLRADIFVQLADAERRLLDVGAAESAVAQAHAAATTGYGKSPARLVMIEAAIAYERGRLRRALELLATLDAGTRSDKCDPALASDIAQREGTVRLIRRELPEATADFSSALASLVGAKLSGTMRDGEILYGLAIIAGMERDFGRSAILFDRAIEAFRSATGRSSEAEVQALIEKARMLGDAGRSAEGVETARKALNLLDGQVEQAPLTRAYARAALGLAARQSGDLETAQRELEAALALFEQKRGDSFDLTPGLNALGDIALQRGDLARATKLFRRALEVERASRNDSSLTLGVALSKLSFSRAREGARDEALTLSAQAKDVLRKRLTIGEARPWNDANAERVAARSITVADLELVTGGSRQSEVVAQTDALRMLDASQLANATSTGAAIAQMSTRLKVADPAIGALLDERNDLAARWRASQNNLFDVLSGFDESGDRAALLRAQQEAGIRISQIDRQLISRDPRLELLIKSRTVNSRELQASLKQNEAAFAITVADDATYVVVIGRELVLGYRVPLDRREVERLVKAIRQTVDPRVWSRELPPFDVDDAHKLYSLLFGPAEAMLKPYDTLLIVPDGPIASLPFSLLVTKPMLGFTGNPKEYSDAPWLISRYAIANFPSLASIVTLRQGRSSGASDIGRTLGVGNPNFEGSEKIQNFLAQLSSSAQANVDTIRHLEPLPDTQKELEEIADTLGRSSASLLLGSEANEWTIKTMPLKEFRTIVFATHGFVAGELTGYAEAGLALSPPEKASPENDGYLSASEIASLRLDANWVILSACNTAASDGTPQAEPLSGLAKSFFYAGARSLLVTHWTVSSEASSKISAQSVAAAASGSSGAQALRLAALKFIHNDDSSWRTHPFFWAGFALIGGQ